jgi:hypothetical protein
MGLSMQRDPFARGEFYRRTHTWSSEGNIECAWCGSKKHRLYSYVWWPDGLGPAPLADHRRFCDFGCFSDFHGLNRR